MRTREFLRLHTYEQINELREAARAVDAALNLYGKETIEELVELADDESSLDERLNQLTTPDNDAFPGWYCDAAIPACNKLRKVAKQWRIAVDNSKVAKL